MIAAGGVLLGRTVVFVAGSLLIRMEGFECHAEKETDDP